MVWRGKKTKPKETRRRDGRGLPGGLDRTGQDRPGPNQGEGDENQQSGGNRDRQTDTHTQHGDQDQTDQIDRSRAEHTHTQRASCSHWHTATVQANEKKNDNGVGDCAVLCCALRCAVCVCSLCWAAEVVVCCTLLANDGPTPVVSVMVIGSLPSICGSVSSVQRRNPFRFGPPFCCLPRW